MPLQGQTKQTYSKTEQHRQEPKALYKSLVNILVNGIETGEVIVKKITKAV